MSEQTKKLTVFTSLPPKTRRMVHGHDYGLVYQRACIDSWIAAGFDVVSLNSQSEIETLEAFQFPVRYICSPNPRPLMREFLAASRDAETNISGIINADCLLLNYEGLVEGISSGANSGILMVERINIDPVSLLPTGLTCLGFDAFFFAKAHSEGVEIDGQLAVGQPWWDYWLPLEFAISGARLVRLEAPVIIHLDHEQGWSQTRWLEFGRKLLARVEQDRSGNIEGVLVGVDKFFDSAISSREDLGGFGDWVFNWLRDSATLMKASPSGSVGELFANILAVMSRFDGMHAGTLALAQARGDLARYEHAKENAARLELEITTMHDAFERERAASREGHQSVEVYARHLEREVAALREGRSSIETYVGHLEKEVAALREAHTSAEAYANHLEKDTIALKEAHTSAERYALHLEVDMVALKEAHTSAETYALHLEKEVAALRDGRSSIETYVGHLEKEVVALRDALTSAQDYVSHLERNAMALWEAHTSAEAYAFHLEGDGIALKEAHTSVETHALHVEKQVAALRDGRASIETYVAHLEKEVAALREALASSQEYAARLERDAVALKDAHTSAEIHVLHLETDAAALKEAHTSAEKHALYLENEIKLLQAAPNTA